MNRWLALGVVVCACSKDPSPEEVKRMMGPGAAANVPPTRAEVQPILDKHAAMVKAKRAASIAVANDAKAAPPVTEATPLATPLASPPVVPDPRLRAPGDTLFGSPERIADPAAAMRFGFWAAPRLGDHEALLAPDAKVTMKPDALEEYFGEVAKLRYALMVRVRDHKPSRVVVATVGGKVERRYEPGHVVGDAIFYELDTKQRLGAFPFAFQAKGDFVAKANTDEQAETARLEEHLLDSVRGQLVRALADFAIGKGAPTPTTGAAGADALATVVRAINVEFGMKHAGALIDTIEITPGAKPVVKIVAGNPSALDAKARAEIAAFASKQLGADATVEVAKK